VDHKSRRFHIEKIKRLLETRDYSFISPSESAQRVFLGTYPEFRNRCKVIPHLNLSLDSKTTYITNDKLRIAFCGSAMYLKGWDEYLKLAKILFGRVEFYHLSTVDSNESNITHIITDLNEGISDVHTNLLKYNIDLVFIGSICSETFSFTLHEAVSAGCFVISVGSQGNVKSLLTKNTSWGKLYHNIDEVYEDFENDYYSDMVKTMSTRGRILRTREFSQMTLDYLS